MCIFNTNTIYFSGSNQSKIGRCFIASQFGQRIFYFMWWKKQHSLLRHTQNVRACTHTHSKIDRLVVYGVYNNSQNTQIHIQIYDKLRFERGHTKETDRQRERASERKRLQTSSSNRNYFNLFTLPLNVFFQLSHLYSLWERYLHVNSCSNRHYWLILDAADSNDSDAHDIFQRKFHTNRQQNAHKSFYQFQRVSFVWAWVLFSSKCKVPKKQHYSVSLVTSQQNNVKHVNYVS